MNIWLSWYATQCIQQYKDFEILEGRAGTLDDNEIFRGLMSEGSKVWKDPSIQAELSQRSERAMFANLVAPMIGESEDLASPLAIKIDQAPAFERPADYSDEEIVVEGRKILSRYSVVYLDLGERLFMMTGGVFQLRALFAHRNGSVNSFCAIICRPGTNKGWRLVWREGRHQRNPENSDYDDVWALASTDIRDPARPINFRKIDYTCLAGVESLFWLALVCWQHLSDTAVPPMPAPPLPPSNAPVLPLGWWDDDMIVDDRLSLFRMVRMPAIDEYRIKKARQGFSREAHKKCRHEVAGHFRWQACGKGRKERRRIWVASHKRGSGPARTLLHVLPAGRAPMGLGYG